MFLTWVLQYVFPMRGLHNKGRLNWGEPGPFALLLPESEYVYVFNGKLKWWLCIRWENFLALSMTLVVSNSAESILSSVRVPPSLRNLDSMYFPKIVKLSLDVNFGLTSWLRDLKISSSSSSIFPSYVFPPLTILFFLRSTFYFFWSVDDLTFVDVTAALWCERSLSNSPSDWLKFKLFSTSVISSYCLHQIYLQHLT